jgi:hypothetical protein
LAKLVVYGPIDIYITVGIPQRIGFNVSVTTPTGKLVRREVKIIEYI